MEAKDIDLFTTVSEIRRTEDRIYIHDVELTEPAAIMSIRQARILARAILELAKEVQQ
jgi:uncharacterized UPF0146 family protein